MPAYNFMKRFVNPIRNGEKTHTIRRRRARRLTVPGDSLMLYTGMRTPDAFMFAAGICTQVEPVVIYPWEGRVLVADERGAWRELDAVELVALAKADGFEDYFGFLDFFKRYERTCLDDFEIIHWELR